MLAHRIMKMHPRQVPKKALYVPQSPPLVYKAATSDLTVRAALFIQSTAQVDEGVDFLNRLTTLTCSC